MMTALIDIKNTLLQAVQVASGLIKDGIPVNEIRIRGRARPAIQVRYTRDRPLQGTRYAWGSDRRGTFERYATVIDGVQVQWEMRYRQSRRLNVVPFLKQMPQLQQLQQVQDG